MTTDRTRRERTSGRGVDGRTGRDPGRAAGASEQTRERESLDAALVRRLQAGDHSAFDDLYRLYLTSLYGYLVVSLGDHHAAEDAAHEVFTRALRALPRYQQRGLPFGHWLFRIARNHVVDINSR